MFMSSCIFPEEISESVYACVIDINDGFIFAGDAEMAPQSKVEVEKKYASVLEGTHYLGRYDDVDCILYVVNRRKDPEVHNNTAAYSLWTLFDTWDSDIWFVAGYAWQIFEWDRNFKYCGRCGVATSLVNGERARRCDHCGLVNYPRISPSMIVMVQKDNQILLAKNAQFKRPFYSILAGFMEPGESLYECVEREVYEEVRLKVKNIQFHESQYWPMSGSLMLGCTAEYDSGEIQIDKKELSHAAWYKADALPKVPTTKSIAGKMIDLFVQKQKTRL